jgi:carbamoyltransferase
MVEYISCLLEKFSNNKKTNIFLAGGIFANIKLNQKISNLPNVKHCYVFPNMGDGGLGAGCALDTSFRHNELSFRNRQSMSLGSNYTSFNKDLISNSKYEILDCSNVYKFIASKLNEKKIIGIFQGKMEYGPRALGNRSIICSAKDNAINNILNHKLKRSEFMPFAPCVLNEDFSKFFESNMEPEDFEYMTFTCKTKKICEDLVPAIVHIDKTARPQTVYKEKNNFLYTLLSEYKKITGVGLLINTSFNVHEEPIVESCEDALKAFEMSKLDYLVLENLVIQIKK